MTASSSEAVTWHRLAHLCMCQMIGHRQCPAQTPPCLNTHRKFSLGSLWQDQVYCCRKWCHSHLNPGATSAQRPVRSQMQYGSCVWRQRLWRNTVNNELRKTTSNESQVTVMRSKTLMWNKHSKSVNGTHKKTQIFWIMNQGLLGTSSSQRW